MEMIFIQDCGKGITDMDRDMVLRMSCALGKAVDLYTEINIEDGRYRFLDFGGRGIYGVASEGDYAEVFAYMMDNEIHEEDTKALWEVFSMEKLREAYFNTDDTSIKVRYRMKQLEPVCWMESTAIILRETNPGYVCVIARDVTKDVQYEHVKEENIRRSEYEEQLRQEQERIQGLLDGTNTIIYEYDVQEDNMSFAGKSKHTGEQIKYAVEHYVRDFEEYHIIYKEDKDEFIKQFKDLIQHGGEREIRYRADYFSKGYRWYKAVCITMVTEQGIPGTIIGRVDDIHTEMETENELRKRAEMDELTGVLNKGTITERVNKSLCNYKRGQLGALFIFDIDNFKMVNDTLGHLFGDFLLQSIASKIAAHFREGDIVGRIGGDEFMAYVEDVRSVEAVKEKVERILETCRKIEIPELERVRCSVGIAMVSDTGIHYKRLFEKADAALYIAKQKGKDCYMMYDPCIERSIEVRNRRASEREKTHVVEVEQNLAKYIFNMLYNAVDTERVISSMLNYIGEYVNVSRAYIFEFAEDGNLCSNTFEWCMENVEAKIAKCQSLSLREGASDYMQNFNEDGIFYCRDVSALPMMQRMFCEKQGVKSMLQCTILDAGKIRGFVGLDECRKHRLWTIQEIDMIQFASQVLSTFLLKQRVQDEIEETSRSMYELLDKSNSSVYIVEPDTYQILYANELVVKALGRKKPSRPCFKEMFGLDVPCNNCPIKSYKENGEVCSVKVYNPIYDKWYETEAKPIIWKREKKIMVQCKDITELMKEIERLESQIKEYRDK